MRNAFTMIELIFVIVILGILSAVALPKFIGVAESTNETVCKAYIGSLNRTVSHSIWAASILIDPEDYDVTVAKLQANMREDTQCGTFAQYVGASEGTPFDIRIGNSDFTISGTHADSMGPAQWAMAEI